MISTQVDGVTDLPGGLQPVIDPTASTATNVEEHCFADSTNTFHVWVDPYASELGSWKFLECGDTAMPILAVEKGVTYTFDQSDASNWYHPLAFGTELRGNQPVRRSRRAVRDPHRHAVEQS